MYPKLIWKLNEFIFYIIVNYFDITEMLYYNNNTYISLLIMFCIIEYVTNKTLNPWKWAKIYKIN